MRCAGIEFEPSATPAEDLGLDARDLADECVELAAGTVATEPVDRPLLGCDLGLDCLKAGHGPSGSGRGFDLEAVEDCGKFPLGLLAGSGCVGQRPTSARGDLEDRFAAGRPDDGREPRKPSASASSTTPKSCCQLHFRACRVE
jgi:hypothetical protein